MNHYIPISLFKSFKRRVTQCNLVDSLTLRCRESFLGYEYLREIKAKIGTA
jgi:hypothetical protein